MRQALFYRAQTTGNMWDTWIYFHDGTHYLFHLSGLGGKWHGISLATSTDAVHWEERGLVIQKDEETLWLGTGSVWQVASSGAKPRFIMNFSQWKGEGQTIFFAESDDLVHWRRLGAESEFKPDGRWYSTGGGDDGRWDTINALPKSGGGFYGWWTANPIGVPGLGFGESADGLTWAALPPPRFEWGDIPPVPGIEQGGIAEIGGKFHTMLGRGRAYWNYGSGMFNFVADQVGGPFRPSAANYALLTSPPDRGNAYFSRFYPLGNALLVNHHSISPDGEVYLAPLKLVEVDSRGVLRLKWWPGNLQALSRWQRSALPSAQQETNITYNPATGTMIDATTRAEPSGVAVITLESTDKARVLRLVIHSDGRVDCEVPEPGPEFRLLERIDRALGLHGPIAVRLLVMHQFVELYLNEYLLTVQSIHPAAAGILQLRGMDFISCLADSV